MICQKENCKKDAIAKGLCKTHYRTEYMRKYRDKNREKVKQYQDDYNKKYYVENKDEIRENTKKWYYENQEHSKQKHKEYAEKNKDRLKEYFKGYYQENKEHIQANNKKNYDENWEEWNKRHYQNYKKPKYHNDENYRLKECIAARIRGALLHGYKSASTMELIGCTIDELKQHLEKQFLPGMTWDNHAITGWHIDHIIPCDNFDLIKEEEQKKCFHYINLQPLWYKENLVKGNKIGDEQ